MINLQYILERNPLPVEFGDPQCSALECYLDGKHLTLRAFLGEKSVQWSQEVAEPTILPLAQFGWECIIVLLRLKVSKGIEADLKYDIGDVMPLLRKQLTQKVEGNGKTKDNSIDGQVGQGDGARVQEVEVAQQFRSGLPHYADWSGSIKRAWQPSPPGRKRSSPGGARAVAGQPVRAGAVRFGDPLPAGSREVPAGGYILNDALAFWAGPNQGLAGAARPDPGSRDGVAPDPVAPVQPAVQGAGGGAGAALDAVPAHNESAGLNLPDLADLLDNF